MIFTEKYNPNDKVWFCGKAKQTTKFYRPSINNQMFFTTNPEYALMYMTTGYNDTKNSCCIVATMNQFKLNVFDFTDRNHVKKLKYPKEIEDILLQDSFWQSIDKMYQDCFEHKTANRESIEWYQNKFKALLNKDIAPADSNEDLYSYQAIILEDIKNLPDKFTAYYCWDYDDEHDGGATISLFNVDAIDKVVPIILSFDDTKDLIDEVKDNKLDLNDINKVKDFIAACTGKYLT